MAGGRAVTPRPEGWPAQLDASLFPTPGDPAQLPERLASDARLGPPWAGVCISGGGSRSLAAAMGELRGLFSLGLLDQIGWISTVSGGTWAGTLFNFAPESISDETLLGPLELDPSKLRWDSGGPGENLGILDPHAIGSAATRLGLEEMLAKAVELYHAGVPVSELWPRAIGELVLAPFGLGDEPQRYFTWTPRWLEQVILPHNPKLSAADFVTTRPNRPYLITSSTLFYPPTPPALAQRTGALASPWEVGYGFETTPMVAGIPPAFPNAGPPSPGAPGSADLGGGWIDPFALGSVAPQSIGADRRFQVPAPANRFRLSDLAGLSSLAFAYDVIDLAHKLGIHFLDDMVAEVTYWPVLRAGQLPRNAARPYLFGDGGNLENQGIMPLLRRGLKKIIAFVNTETQLSVQGPNHEVVVDSDLPPLFGLEWSATKGAYVPTSPSSPFRFNQVFDRAAFDDFRHQLWTRAQAGATAMALQQNVPVAANPHYGVPAGSTDILCIYLNPVGWWQSQLHESVRLAMELEPWNYAMFPNYYTVGQLRLNQRQVDLLAYLSNWNVSGDVEAGGLRSNEASTKSFLGLTPDKWSP